MNYPLILFHNNLISGILKGDGNGNVTMAKAGIDYQAPLEDWNDVMLLKNIVVALPTYADWQSVCYGNGKFVAVVNASDIAAYSTDGVTWTQTTLPANTDWQSVCYGNGKFVTVAAGDNDDIITYSTDGINWANSAFIVSNPAETVVTANLNEALGVVTMGEVNFAIQSAIQNTWEASY